MKNLARDKNCDDEIRCELEAAGITVVATKGNGEVPATVKGTLNGFVFERAWTYWVVTGKVPLHVAEEMFAKEEEGTHSLRPCGNGLFPKEWALPSRDVLKKFMLNHPEEGTELSYGRIAELCNSGAIKGPRFVESYHIDTQEGLNLFVDTIKKHNVDGGCNELQM